METAVITTARKRKKEIRINPEINNPGHAHKVSPDRKVISPNHKAISPNHKAISDGENNPGVTNPSAPTIHPDHKERNQPEMKNLLKNKTSLLKSLILLFIASFHTACDEQTVYHSFQSLPTEGWQRNDTLFFNVSVADSATLYNVSVEVRNRNNYPYQNLPLLIYYDSPEALNIKRVRRWLGRVISINSPSRLRSYWKSRGIPLQNYTPSTGRSSSRHQRCRNQIKTLTVSFCVLHQSAER